LREEKLLFYIHTSTGLLNVFTAWYFITYRDNFTFLLGYSTEVGIAHTAVLQ